MASFNQPNGTSTYFIPRSSNFPRQAGPNSLGQFTGSNFPTVDSTSTAYEHAYTNPFTPDRSRPNAPFNAATPNPTHQFPTWNAAALLNPRGFQKSQQKDERKPNMPISNGPPSNIAFQFDSPVSSASPVQHPHPPVHGVNGHGYVWPDNEAPGIGMGPMLERMHNVSERDFLPQKRRKLDREEDDDNTRKAHFSGGGKGGVLGEYMKEKQEQGRKEAAANGTRPSVDLTQGMPPFPIGAFRIIFQNLKSNSFTRGRKRRCCGSREHRRYRGLLWPYRRRRY
jgi:hypothetical protein